MTLKKSVQNMQSGNKLLDFIKICNATDNASLKSLHKFILSLSHSSLKHLIKSYLIHSIITNNEISITQSYTKWISNKNQNDNIQVARK